MIRFSIEERATVSELDKEKLEQSGQELRRRGIRKQFIDKMTVLPYLYFWCLDNFSSTQDR